MNILKTVVTLNEATEPSSPQEVVAALSQALVGKKITAFGPKGGGIWGEHPEVQTYRIKKIVGHFGKMDDGEPEWANIDIHLDGYHVNGSKVKDKDGHTAIVGGAIYTDKTFINHLKAMLHSVPAMKFIKSLGYSEHGMQGSNSVNLDIDFNKKVLANAMADNLIRKGSKKSVKEAVDKYAEQRTKLGKMNSKELHDHFTKVLGATKDTIKDVAKRTAERHGLAADHYAKKLK